MSLYDWLYFALIRSRLSGRWNSNELNAVFTLLENSSMVRAPDSWSKVRGFESRQERRENFLLQGQLSVLTLISVSVPAPCYRIARKRSRSFCQKCRWQVTAKYACTLRMWLCMKWHGAWLYGVHRTCAETAAISSGTSHASAVTTSVDIQKRAIKS